MVSARTRDRGGALEHAVDLLAGEDIPPKHVHLGHDAQHVAIVQPQIMVRLPAHLATQAVEVSRFAEQQVVDNLFRIAKERRPLDAAISGALEEDRVAVKPERAPQPVGIRLLIHGKTALPANRIQVVRHLVPGHQPGPDGVEIGRLRGPQPLRRDGERTAHEMRLAGNGCLAVRLSTF